MNVHTESGNAAAEIRALIERCAKAFREKDVDTIMACHTGTWSASTAIRSSRPRVRPRCAPSSRLACRTCRGRS